MKSHTEYLWFNTKKKREFINITSELEKALAKSGVQEGLVLASAMHITAGVYINDAEDGLIGDIEEWLEKLAPFRADYRHHQTGEDNGDARAPEEPADRAPGPGAGHPWQARLRTVAAGVLCRIRRAATQTRADQDHWGVGGGREAAQQLADSRVSAVNKQDASFPTSIVGVSEAVNRYRRLVRGPAARRAPLLRDYHLRGRTHRHRSSGQKRKYEIEGVLHLNVHGAARAVVRVPGRVDLNRTGAEAGAAQPRYITTDGACRGGRRARRAVDDGVAGADPRCVGNGIVGIESAPKVDNPEQY